VDAEPRTFNIDPTLIEAKITEKTKAILPVHLFGHPADLEPILEIARRHDLWVIEDAALAVGAEVGGRKVGTLGDVGCFSMAPTKILGAYGDAGVVTTDRQEIADKVKVLRNYGHALSMAEDVVGLGTSGWVMEAEGYNERLDALQAAIVRAKLPTLEQRIAARRQVAQRYNELLSDLDLTTPYEAEGMRHVYRAYTILVDDPAQVQQHLERKGIATRLYYIPLLHVQPVYEHMGYRPGDFPVSEEAAARMICLPIFPEMTDEQINEVVAAVREVVPQR
jgi:dTDP-4-amino-4,6-dideoxygalactose transaminase